jgi:hypothetical protein
MASEGSEKQRYTNILQELQQGATVCGENGD